MDSPVLIVRYTFTPLLLCRAQNAFVSHQRWRRVLSPGGVAVFLAFLVVVRMLSGVTLSEAIWVNLPWIIGLPAFDFLMLPWMQRWSAGLTYRRTPALHHPRVFTFSPNGFSFEAGPTREDVQWSAIASARETEEFVLLCFNKRLGHVIPKGAFRGATEVASLRRFVVEAIGSRAHWSGTVGDAASHCTQ